MPVLGAAAASTEANGYNPAGSFYLPSDTALHNWRKQLAATRMVSTVSTSYFGSAQIVCYGDSITDRGFDFYLRQHLADDGRFGSVVQGPLWTNPSLGIAAPSGWGYGQVGPGGGSLLINSATVGGGGVAFTHTDAACDRFAVTVLNDSSADKFTIAVDGGTAVECTPSKSGGIQTFSIVASGGVGSHTLSIGPRLGTNGTRNVVVAIEALAGPDYHAPTFSSTVRRRNTVTVTRYAVAGSNSVQWSTAASRALAFSGQNNGSRGLGAHLAVLYLGYNDMSNGTSAATYKANMASLVVAAQAQKTDVVLCTMHQSGNVALATLWPQYNAAIYELADQYGCMVVDLSRRWPPYAQNQDGILNGSSDPAHPNEAGIIDLAHTIGRAIAAAS